MSGSQLNTDLLPNMEIYGLWFCNDFRIWGILRFELLSRFLEFRNHYSHPSDALKLYIGTFGSHLNSQTWECMGCDFVTHFVFWEDSQVWRHRGVYNSGIVTHTAVMPWTFCFNVCITVGYRFPGNSDIHGLGCGGGFQIFRNPWFHIDSGM